MYNITTDKKKLNIANKSLRVLYSKMPATKGCIENINKQNGCNAWCCDVQTPQVLYVEFLHTWKYMIENFTYDQFVEIVQNALNKYLFAEKNEACIFFDRSSRMCKQHDTRPYNCRIYGITPDEEFRPRYEKLKVIYPNIKYQCSLVQTVDNKAVTKKNIDDWWLELKSIELYIGVRQDLINDADGGTYRTLHDHMLLHILGEEGMEYLSFYRENGSDHEKSDIIHNLSKKLDAFFKK